MQLIHCKSPFPLEIEWSLTWRCNLNCVFCSTANLRGNELDYRTILDEIIRCRPICVTLSGGEPLLHPHIDIITYELKRNNILVNLTTNGVLLNSRYLSKSTMSKFNWVRISIHSIDEKIDKMLMGEDYSLMCVLKNIERFLLINNRLSLFVLLTRANCNYENLSSIIFLAKKLNIKKITVGCAKVLGRALPNQIVDVERLIPLFLRAKKLADQQNVSLQYPTGISNSKGCLTANTSISVGPDGTVKSCIFMKEALGTVQNGISFLWKEKHNPKFSCTECMNQKEVNHEKAKASL